MADPTTPVCTNPEHAILVATISEQTRLISQLLARTQELERRLDVAQEAARNPVATQNLTIQTPNFSTSEGSRDRQDYSPSASSAYEAKKAQAQGQPCIYGSKCIREQCWYEHSGSRVAGNPKSSASTTNQSQTTDTSVNRNKRECKYGMNCTNRQCWFEHPSGWTPNRTDQEWKPQQEPIPEAPAAEASTWGTSEDLSSWGVTPSSDWGTSADNTWGPPARADNEWGNPTDTWNTQPDKPHKSSVSNSRSTSVSMSREGSVSNSSTSKSQGRGRKSRGKGRRADSESIATESTPMSPSPLAATSISASVEPIPVQTPLSPPADSTDQAPSYEEANALDGMGTPPLEPSVPSLSSEPEAPATPKALWSDEPTVDVVYFPDAPPNHDESQPSGTRDKGIGFSEDQPPGGFVDESLDLDQRAPSDLYSSWGVGVTGASDWGLDPTEFPDPVATTENKSKGKKSKSKGKQKENSQTDTSGRGTPNNPSNFAAQPETSTPSVNESEEPEPTPKATPEPPQGVPQDEIPDWLLGDDEDAHAALGIPRSVSPSPGTSAPPRIAPTGPAPRPPLSKLAAENFPSLSGILSASKSLQSKDDTPPKPEFTPRPVPWKITRPSDTSSSTSSKSGKGSKSKN